MTLTADGWSEGDGEFSYEIVDADGESAAKGDIKPGKELPSTYRRVPTP